MTAEKPAFVLPELAGLWFETRYRITEADVAFTQRSGGVKVRPASRERGGEAG